jgi:predicted DNA-binding transcriptional regulator AlpA
MSANITPDVSEALAALAHEVAALRVDMKRRIDREHRELWTLQDIADELCLSKKTVQNYVVTRTDFPNHARIGIGPRRWWRKAILAWAENSVER